MSKTVILTVGTRPEGIKMIPVYYAFKNAGFNPVICSTAQHRSILDEVFDVFDVAPDVDLDIMKAGQDLFHINSLVLLKMRDIFKQYKPSLVLVQGDTTTVMASASAAFYMDIPIGHVEAGLRTNDIRAPFPEEFNRRVAALVAKYNFAPTKISAENLLKENIDPNTIFCTGNTVVDALRIIKDRIETKKIIIDKVVEDVVESVKKNGKQLIVLTAHRRESFGGGIERILKAVKNFAESHPNVFFFYPYHPNPNVLKAIESVDLKSTKNIFMTKPIAYKEMVYLLLNASWVATDSGGIQEEAVSLNKHVLVLREKTERPEGILTGLAHLVGTDSVKIKKMMEKLTSNSYNASNNFTNVYGDGYAAEKIVSICEKKW
ncbi:UDP-N-acetylglucosamine 2-epimerase (non-hydrolyzing) [bacterium]|jgi:UDP-N-acetylglucosamine 2-epimerase (non-hydrolysing)|nr:UDP-N-acetylglucosamine 2-epimerase (non-hydrolyzing) [bacterium]